MSRQEWLQKQAGAVYRKREQGAPFHVIANELALRVEDVKQLWFEEAYRRSPKGPDRKMR